MCPTISLQFTACLCCKREKGVKTKDKEEDKGLYTGENILHIAIVNFEVPMDAMP